MEPSPLLPNEGGDHTEVGRPETWKPGALEVPYAWPPYKQKTMRVSAIGCTTYQVTGLPNPIAVFQRPANDKTQTQYAQAGGFSISCRQRRKVL